MLRTAKTAKRLNKNDKTFQFLWENILEDGPIHGNVCQATMYTLIIARYIYNNIQNFFFMNILYANTQIHKYDPFLNEMFIIFIFAFRIIFKI